MRVTTDGGTGGVIVMLIQVAIMSAAFWTVAIVACLAGSAVVLYPWVFETDTSISLSGSRCSGSSADDALPPARVETVAVRANETFAPSFVDPDGYHYLSVKIQSEDVGFAPRGATRWTQNLTLGYCVTPGLEFPPLVANATGNITMSYRHFS